MTTRREFIRDATALGIGGMAMSGRPAEARTMRDVSESEAKRVHDTTLIIDGHNDTPVLRVSRNEDPLQWMNRDINYHADVPRMRDAGYDAGFMIVGNGNVANVFVTAERMLRQIEMHPDAMLLVLKSGDVLEARDSGRLGVIMSIEGAGRWLNAHVEYVHIMHRLGIRLIGISHGEGGEEPEMLQGTRSPYGPATPAEREAERRNAGGLTQFGRDVLAACNDLGIVTDLSHINDKAFYEVLELSSLPPIMSHTAVFGECNHWRCLTDDQMKALADADGVMGIAFAPGFIDSDPDKVSIDRLVEHIVYAVDLVGIEHVAIGTDFDGLSDVPVVPEVSQLWKLTRSMLAHGFTEDEVYQIWGGNFLRILRRTIDTV